MSNHVFNAMGKLCRFSCRLRLFYILVPLCFLHSNGALAQNSEAFELNCEKLLYALKNKKISEEFYNEICGKNEEVKINNLFTAANAEQIVESIATRSPTMIQKIKSYGDPKQIIEILGQKSLDQKHSVLSGLNWNYYQDLIEYITSNNINYYIKEFLFSTQDSPDTRNRFTTLFWVALRSNDSFFIRNVLKANLTPYSLELDPTAFGNFPCAANIYLCVIKSNEVGSTDKQNILSTLESFSVKAPSWTRTVIWKDFSSFNFRYASVPNENVCRAAGSNDCQFAMSILKQQRVNTRNEAFIFTDYAGYDAVGKRHLFSGQVQDDVFAAWIPASQSAGELLKNRTIDIVSYKVTNNQISQYKNQVGKRIQYFDRLAQRGILAFDNVRSAYIVQITERKFF